MDDRPRRNVSSGSPFEPRFGYSRAVRLGGHVAVAGTAPQRLDGTVDDDVEAQARRCLEIIESALQEVGAELVDVVRTRVYLVDVDDFDAVARAHHDAFADVRPANSTVVVAALLDERWRVEIEVDAILDPSRPPR